MLRSWVPSLACKGPCTRSPAFSLLILRVYIGVYLFGGPYNKDYSILGSILGYPNFGELPYMQKGAFWFVFRMA